MKEIVTTKKSENLYLCWTLFKPEGHWDTLMPLESLLRFTPLEEMEGV